MKDHYELIILGGGPAGLSAGLYAARARLDHVLIEKGAPGGQVLLTDWVDNYPAFPEGLSGFDLVEKMTEHAKRFDLNIELGSVTKVDPNDGRRKILHLEGGEQVSCDTLILCNGASANTLNIPGEMEMRGKGVSYCGTCDAPFYRNMHVAVIGGGNTAIQEAEYLTKFASKVTVIHRREELRATKIIQEIAFANEKIEFVWNSRVTSIEGENEVERLNLLANDGTSSTLDVQGVFILIGVTPNNDGLPLQQLEVDKWGFIPINGESQTTIPGVMAAGDICSKEVRQIVNAAGEGAVAVLAAERFLQDLKKTTDQIDNDAAKKFFRFKSLVASGCLSFWLLTFSGCGSLKEMFNVTSIDEDGNEITEAELNLPAKSLLAQGMGDYNVGKYFTAIEFFDDILNRYPFSPEATLAELKAADCSYHLERYLEALVLYEEFENRHPTNESIPYVMFQKAMCNYKQIDRIDRDTAGAIKSIELFKQLLKAYPNSPYTGEAKARITAATEFLANHEYFVVEYYVRTAKYDQAIVRLKYLLVMYPESDIATKAQELLTRIEAGDPPRSRLTAWFPKLALPDWAIFGQADVEDTTAEPVQR